MQLRGVIVLGPYGGGKDTFAKNLEGFLRERDLHFRHLNVGGACRERLRTEKFRRKYSETMSDRRLLPDAVIRDMILEESTKKSSEERIDGWFLNGFPRNWGQAIMTRDLLWNLPIDGGGRMAFKNTRVLMIDLSDERCITRIVNDPERTGRTDNDIGSTRKALAEFRREWPRIHQVFKERSFRVDTISSEGTPEETLEQGLRVLGLEGLRGEPEKSELAIA